MTAASMKTYPRKLSVIEEEGNCEADLTSAGIESLAFPVKRSMHDLSTPFSLPPIYQAELYDET